MKLAYLCCTGSGLHCVSEKTKAGKALGLTACPLILSKTLMYDLGYLMDKYGYIMCSFGEYNISGNL